MKCKDNYRILNKNAVSNVIGVILMVAITIAVAAVVFIHFSGMLGGVNEYTASISCITDSSSDRIIVTTTSSPLIQWKDVEVITENATVNWQVYDSSHQTLDVVKSTLNATNDISSGDYIEFDFAGHPGMSGNVRVSMRFIPTNTLIGSWIITV